MKLKEYLQNPPQFEYPFQTFLSRSASASPGLTRMHLALQDTSHHQPWYNGGMPSATHSIHTAWTPPSLLGRLTLLKRGYGTQTGFWWRFPGWAADYGLSITF